MEAEPTRPSTGRKINHIHWSTAAEILIVASSSISLPLPHSSAVFISRARLHFVPSLIFFLPFNLFSSFFCALSSCLSLSLSNFWSFHLSLLLSLSPSLYLHTSQFLQIFRCPLSRLLRCRRRELAEEIGGDEKVDSGGDRGRRKNLFNFLHQMTWRPSWLPSPSASVVYSTSMHTGPRWSHVSSWGRSH